MAAFTTIAMAAVTLAKIGSGVAKGFIAKDASKTAARQSGRLTLEQKQLEEQSVARLEQNFVSAVRVPTDAYDKALQTGNVMGAEILEAVQEGDQRGVAAASGKVNQIQNANLEKVADAQSKIKFDRDMKEAEAGELSASEIALLEDDRANAAGMKADALMAQSDKLKGDSTASFISAGQAALEGGVNLSQALSGNAANKAADSLGDDAVFGVDGQGGMSPQDIRNYNSGYRKQARIDKKLTAYIENSPAVDNIFLDPDYMSDIFGGENIYSVGGFNNTRIG